MGLRGVPEWVYQWDASVYMRYIPFVCGICRVCFSFVIALFFFFYRVFGYTFLHLINLYGSEGMKRVPEWVPHYAEGREPLGRPIENFHSIYHDGLGYRTHRNRWTMITLFRWIWHQTEFLLVPNKIPFLRFISVWCQRW